MEFREMRRFKQQLSHKECIEILKNAPRGVIAMNDENGYPYAVTINQYYDESDGKIYFHGAMQGKKVELLAKNNKICFTTTDEGHIEEGDWANTFKSVVCFGHVDEVTDKEKIYSKLRRLAKRFYPSAESIEKEMEEAGSRVKMFVISIDHMTGKSVNEK